MNESRYEAVIFKDIAKSYPSDADIVCRFVTKSWDRQLGDFVGVYKVGWSRLEQAITAKPVDDAITERSGELRLVFPASLFADRENERDLLQFCYLSGQNVKGASTPFEVYRPAEEDMTEIDENLDDDGDFVMLKSKDARFQEKIDKLQSEVSLLQSEKEQILSELREKNITIQSKDDEIKNLELQLRSKEDTIDQKEQKIGLIFRTLGQTQETLEEKTKLFDDLQENIDRLQKKMEQLNHEKDDLREQLENEKSFSESTQEKLKLTIQQLKQERETFESKMNAAKETIETLSLAREKIEMDKDRLTKYIDDLKTRLTNSTKTIEDQAKQIQELTSNLEKVSSSKEHEVDMTKKIEELTRRLEAARIQYERKEVENVKLEGKYRRLQDKVNNFIKLSKTLPSSKKLSESSSSAEGLSPNETSVKERANIEEQARGQAVEELAAEASASILEEDVAAEVITLPCTICREDIICTYKDLRQMTNHLEQAHNQRVCPVCSQLFDAKMSGINEYFASHIESHFDVPQFPHEN